MSKIDEKTLAKMRADMEMLFNVIQKDEQTITKQNNPELAQAIESIKPSPVFVLKIVLGCMD